MNKKTALPLALILTLLMVAPAWASKDAAATSSPVATTPALSTALPAAPPEPLFLAGGTPCICQCTCPSSGSFVNQCVVLPPWSAGGCSTLNNQRCNSGLFACNQQEILQNCSPPEISPVLCGG